MRERRSHGDGHNGDVDDSDLMLYIYIYLYIYAVKLITRPRFGHFKVNNWATFVFYKKLFCKKHYKNRGFSRFFLQKKREHKICKVNNWATLPIFKWPKRGPVINSAGGPVINFGKWSFLFIFLLLKMC